MSMSQVQIAYNGQVYQARIPEPPSLEGQPIVLTNDAVVRPQSGAWVTFLGICYAHTTTSLRARGLIPWGNIEDLALLHAEARARHGELHFVEYPTMSEAPCLWADVVVDIASPETWLHIAGLLPEGQARLYEVHRQMPTAVPSFRYRYEPDRGQWTLELVLSVAEVLVS